jgi:hypothetical protein
MEGYGFPPPNYIPERPVITDISLFSKEITNRLFAFGFRTEDLKHAFSPNVDQKRPNHVRATYFLLQEMLQRQEVRLKAEKAKSSSRKLGKKN